MATLETRNILDEIVRHLVQLRFNVRENARLDKLRVAASDPNAVTIHQADAQNESAVLTRIRQVGAAWKTEIDALITQAEADVLIADANSLKTVIDAKLAANAQTPAEVDSAADQVLSAVAEPETLFRGDWRGKLT